MPHQAGPEFFNVKRPWSKYKDAVLAYYLTPYLEHTKALGKPIYLIDMFAGPGRFLNEAKDQGSPLILCLAAKRFRERGHDVRVLLIERDPVLFGHLRTNTAEFAEFATIRNADCTDLVDDIAKIADKNTTLIYADPYTMSGLYLHRLGQIYDAIQESASSVEVLLVFFGNELLRQASACLSLEGSLVDEHILDLIFDDEDKDPLKAAAISTAAASQQKAIITTREELSRIAGGDYWRTLAEPSEQPFAERVEEFVRQYSDQMRRWFKVVGTFPIRAREHLRMTKYWLIWGSRYRPAIRLVNDAMASVQRAQRREWGAGTLFGGLDFGVVPADAAADGAVLRSFEDKPKLPWNEVCWRAMERQLGDFKESELNRAVKRLLRSNRLAGASGKRIEPHALLTLQSL